MVKIARFFSIAAFIFNVVAKTSALEKDEIISSWLAQQTNVQTWAAEFVQTRTLKVLAEPLISTGRVWFAAPQNFRWELGQDQTIAIRNNETMLVMYPRLKRAEKYDFQTAGPSDWKDALSMLQTGFPRSRGDIDRQFKILSLSFTNNLNVLALQPRSPGARKMMPEIRILIGTNSSLAGTELVFVDGSTMQNLFRNVQTNTPVEGKFNLDLPADFKLVEPLKGNRK